MHTHNSRAGRFAARLGLETLEGRALPSSLVPALAAAVGHVAAIPDAPVEYLQPASVSKVSHPQAEPTYAHFSYHWSVGPSPVLVGTNPHTANGKSTGSVDFALVRGGTDAIRVGGPAAWVPVGFVMTTSSADSKDPDRFNVNFTVKLHLRDAESGVSADFVFKGTIKGSLNWNAASLKATFQTPLTETKALGNHVYTVTLPSAITPTGPNDMPATLYAQVKVAARH